MVKITKILIVFLAIFVCVTGLSGADLKLVSSQKIENGVKLVFNRAPKQSEISRKVISNRGVIDIKSPSGVGVKNYGSIKIAQYKPEILRVVFNDTDKLNTQISAKTLTISKNQIFKTSSKIQKTNVKTQTKTSSDDAILVASKPRKPGNRKVVVIDPGHGGKDSGALGNNLKEKNIVLSIAKKVGVDLAKRGYRVYYTRDKDIFINLRKRTAMANKANADLFISIHANAAPNKASASKFSGIETYFLSPSNSERSKSVAELENKGDIGDMNEFSKQTFLNFLNREKIIASNKLAIDVQKYMLNSVQKTFSSKDSGVREGPFWVLVGANMPSVLVEVGYITHPSEGKRLGTEQYQKLIAKGIADGVVGYFNKNPQ